MKLRDTDTQTVCLGATTMLRSKPLKPAFLPILIPGFNVSKSTSLHFTPNGHGGTLHGSSGPLVCKCVGEWLNKRLLKSTFGYHKGAGKHLLLLPFDLFM